MQLARRFNRLIGEMYRMFPMLCFMLLVFIISTAFRQFGGFTVPSTAIPWTLWIAFFIGVLLHWLKKRGEDPLKHSFLNWFWENLPSTMGSLATGVLAFMSTWAMNPSAYPEGNPATYILVIMAGWAGDSFNQPGKTAPPVDPGEIRTR